MAAIAGPIITGPIITGIIITGIIITGIIIAVTDCCHCDIHLCKEVDLPENPVRKIRFARKNNESTRFLSPEEESKLLTH